MPRLKLKPPKSYIHTAEGIILVPLVNSTSCAVVDVADWSLIRGVTWRLGYHSNGRMRAVYGWYPDTQKIVYIHRMLMGSPKGMQIDHHDGDVLNNRRTNLRVATVTQNQYNQRLHSNNTTGFKGVYFSRGKYVAQIKILGRVTYLGRFFTAKEASDAYNAAASKLHGEFVRLL